MSLAVHALSAVYFILYCAHAIIGWMFFIPIKVGQPNHVRSCRQAYTLGGFRDKKKRKKKKSRWRESSRCSCWRNGIPLQPAKRTSGVPALIIATNPTVPRFPGKRKENHQDAI